MRKLSIRIIAGLLLVLLLSSVAMASTYLWPYDVVIVVEGGPNSTDGQLYDHDCINGSTVTRTVIGSDYYVYAEPNLVLDELDFTYSDLNNQEYGYTYSVQWTSSDEKVATIHARTSSYTKIDGASVSVRAISNGTARITALTTIEYWYSANEQHHTKTIEAYFDVVVKGGETGNSETGPSSALDYDAIYIPPIDIADYDGNLLTNRTYSLDLNKSATVAVALDTAVWKRDTKQVGNKQMTAFFSRDALGNYYYLQESGIQWGTAGATDCVSADLASGAALALTGVKVGSMTVTATAACGYLVSSENGYVDQGIIGTTSASTTILVKTASTQQNPFKGIDEDQIENPFIDVPNNAWYSTYACMLYAAGMLNGVDVSLNMDGSKIIDTAFGAFSAIGTTVTGNTLGSSMNMESTTASSEKTNSTSSSTGSTSSSSSTSGQLTFNGSGMESRANTVVVMYNGHEASGGSVGSYTSNPFTDVSSGKTYYQPVLWASANSIVNGYGNGKFGPADGITREQFCTILVRYAQYAGITLPSSQTAKSFSDSGKVSSWAKSAVEACQKAGIINGYPDGTFRPKDGISRAEVSKMIYEFYNLLP